MMKYLVGYEEEPFVIVSTKGDAEEMILAIAEDNAYVEWFYNSLPNLSYSKCLTCCSGGFWIQEVIEL